MPVEMISTFQQATPRRPGESDILNGEKENATSTVPPQNPSAEEFMQMGRLIAAFGRMVPLLRISVAYTGSTPHIDSFACVRDDIAITDLVPTHNATGDVTITWPAGKFPAALGQPLASSNRGTAAGRGGDATLVANGVRVFTVDASGAADNAFTVLVY